MKWLIALTVLTIANAGALFSMPVGTHTATVKMHVVIIHGYAFMPRRLVINAGDKVLWINQDSDTHTVTSDGNASIALRSRPLGSGARYTMKFSRPGTFHYHCEFHPFMRGIVQVTAHAPS
jgi:plastocyanin